MAQIDEYLESLEPYLPKVVVECVADFVGLHPTQMVTPWRAWVIDFKALEEQFRTFA